MREGMTWGAPSGCGNATGVRGALPRHRTPGRREEAVPSGRSGHRGRDPVDCARSGDPAPGLPAHRGGSASVLLAAILLALLWANLAPGSYEAVWHTELELRLGDHALAMDLREWVNSGLMTLFFLVVGLEARREFDLGELRDRKRFLLPLVAGLLGMVLPVRSTWRSTRRARAPQGWGVAMSTDTALALGFLSFLGAGRPRPGAGLPAHRVRRRRPGRAGRDRGLLQRADRRRGDPRRAARVRAVPAHAARRGRPAAGLRA